MKLTNQIEIASVSSSGTRLQLWRRLPGTSYHNLADSSMFDGDSSVGIQSGSALFLLTRLRHFNEATQYSVTHDTLWSTVYQTHCLSLCCLLRYTILLFHNSNHFDQVVDLTRSHKVRYAAFFISFLIHSVR